jgi:hypothetical protein
MDVTIKRLFCTPWYQDEGVYGCNNVCTEPISLDSQTHSGNMSKALFFTKLNKSKEVRDSIILETSLKYR